MPSLVRLLYVVADFADVLDEPGMSVSTFLGEPAGGLERMADGCKEGIYLGRVEDDPKDDLGRSHLGRAAPYAPDNFGS